MEIENALALIEQELQPITESKFVATQFSFGMIIARNVKADYPVPSFPKSAMDGYAVRAADTAKANAESPVKLRVLGEILAGDAVSFPYQEQSAVRIMTGARIPEGYDAVVMQERTDYGEKEVRIFAPITSGMNVCPIGEELKRGEVYLKEGERIGRTQLGKLIAAGASYVCVKRPAKIAILSTGNELAKSGEALKEGQIYNTILPMLSASIIAEKLSIIRTATCADDATIIKEYLKELTRVADLVITTGGVSVGKKDLLPELLKELGAKELFSKVNIQPGTPTMMNFLDDTPILSLSGNPYAALANFDLYFWNCMAKLMGSTHFQSRPSRAILADPYEKSNQRRRLVRAFVREGKVYLPTDVHASSVFGNLAACNCYLDVPEKTKLAPGDEVRIWNMPQLS